MALFASSITAFGMSDAALEAYGASCGCEDSGVTVSPAQMQSIISHDEIEMLKSVKIFWNGDEVFFVSGNNFYGAWIRNSSDYLVNIHAGNVSQDNIPLSPEGFRPEFIGLGDFEGQGEFISKFLITVPEENVPSVSFYFDDGWEAGFKTLSNFEAVKQGYIVPPEGEARNILPWD